MPQITKKKKQPKKTTSVNVKPKDADEPKPTVPSKADLGQLDAREAAYKTARQKAQADEFDEAEILAEIFEKRWYLLKAPTFAEYCEKVLDTPKRTGQVLAEIGRAFTREQFAKFGTDRARVGLLLIRATPEHDTAADLVSMKLRYGQGAGKLFAEATRAEILEDIRGERSGGKAPKPPPPLPAPVVKAAREFESMNPLVKCEAYMGPSKRSPTGYETFIDFRHVPFAEMVRVLNGMSGNSQRIFTETYAAIEGKPAPKPKKRVTG